MTDKPKPLTKAEWEATRLETYQPYSTRGRINATIAALFRYRERTRGWPAEYNTFSDTIAAEEGIE